MVSGMETTTNNTTNNNLNTNSNSIPSPQSVGREFVRQYYTVLNKGPHFLHRFTLISILFNIFHFFLIDIQSNDEVICVLCHCFANSFIQICRQFNSDIDLKTL